MSTSDAEKQAQVDAAWAEHLACPGAVRREWLQRRLEENGGKCRYCGIEIVLDGRGGRARASLDHLVPLSRGGEDSYDNSVASCLLCNTAKGDLLPGELEELLVARREAILAKRAKKLKWRPDLRYPH